MKTCVGCNMPVVGCRSYCGDACYPAYQLSTADRVVSSMDKQVLAFILLVNKSAGKQRNRRQYLFENPPSDWTIEQIADALSTVKVEMLHGSDEDMLCNLGRTYYAVRYICILSYELQATDCVIGDKHLVRYDVKYNREIEDRFKDQSILLFHGSPKHNWGAILRTGLKPTNNDLMTTGAAYGKGIYLASEMSTPLSYARGDCIIAICEVLGGEKFKSGPYYVVPDPDIVLVRSLVDVGSLYMQHGTELESALKELYSNKKTVKLQIERKMSMRGSKRVQKELGQIAQHYTVREADEPVIVCGDHCIRLLLDEYPYRAPIVLVTGPVVSCSSINSCGVYLYDGLGDWTPTIKLQTIVNDLAAILCSADHTLHNESKLSEYPSDVVAAKKSISNILEIV